MARAAARVKPPVDLRTKCLENFWAFCTEALKMPLHEKPHREMCDFLEDTVTSSKMMLVPRDCWKTSIGSTAFPLWMVMRAYLLDGNPAYRCLIDSSTTRLSSFVVSAIRDQVQHNDKFIEVFGEQYDRRGDRQEGLKLKFRTGIASGVREPNFVPSGVNAAKTGLHFELMLMDDLVTKENARTADQRQKVYDHYRMMNAIQESDSGGNVDTMVVLIGTRYHDDDIYGRILKQDKQSVAEGQAPIFTTLIRAAVTDDGEYYFPGEPGKPGGLGQVALEKKKKVMGSLFWCTPGHSPVTMADLTQKRIEDVMPGDLVLGFDLGKGKSTYRVKMKPTRVLATSRLSERVQRLHMASGRTVECTDTHRWYTGRFDRDTYAPAKVGSILRYVCTTDDGVDPEWRYLAGIFDGEGTAKSSPPRIYQSPTANPEVTESIAASLKALGVPHSVYDTEASTKNNRNSSGGRAWVLNDYRDTAVRLIRKGGSAKKGQLVEVFYSHPSRLCREEDRVVRIEELGEVPVYALQTETGNYIVWGYASSNSQMMNDPNKEEAPFKAAQLRFKPWADFPKLLKIRLTIDPAVKEDDVSHGDFTAMVVAGWDNWNQMWIMDSIMSDKLTPGKFIECMLHLATRWNVEHILIEDDGSMQAMEILWRREFQERGYSFPITRVPANRQQGKLNRWLDIQPYAERGGIRIAEEIPAGMKVEIADQWSRAPFATHDDFMDALAMQTMYLPVSFKEETGREMVNTGDSPVDVATLAMNAPSRSHSPFYGTLAERFPFLRDRPEFYEDPEPFEDFAETLEAIGS